MIHRLHIVFVTYNSRLNAEFAKAAMSNQVGARSCVWLCVWRPHWLFVLVCACGRIFVRTFQLEYTYYCLGIMRLRQANLTSSTVTSARACTMHDLPT